MKVIIFHGTDASPEDYWYGWLKAELEKAGHTVELPHYPTINHEPVADFLPKVLKNHTFDDDTVLVGHSAGAPLILSLLEHGAKVKQAVLVAGFVDASPKFPASILQKRYDWPKIKAGARDFVFINSDNDPWDCDDKQGRKMFDNLGGTQIIRHDGHFGSEGYGQTYATFPLLRALIIGTKTTKRPPPMTRSLENEPAWKEANSIATHMYGKLRELPPEEEWDTKRKLQSSAVDLIFYVSQALGNGAAANEYEWGLARKAAAGLKTVYRFAGRQKFIRLDPDVMLQLGGMTKMIDGELAKAHERLEAADEAELDLWREKYKLWRKTSEG